jgi:hypothetical protein
MINLETVLNQEVKLSTILEHLKAYNGSNNPTYYLELTQKSEEWWGSSKEAACLFDLYKIYRDGQTRKVLRRAMILETIVIILTVY